MTTNVPTPVVASVLSATLAGLGWLIISRYWYQKKKFPESWSKVGTLQELRAYPIKSCGGIRLLTAECTPMGLRDGWLRDRVLMIVNEKDNFISARQCPEMLLIKTTVIGSVLTLAHSDMESVSVNLAELGKSQKRATAYVWSQPVPVYDCGKEINEWCTRLVNRTLEGKFRLVYYASDRSRPLRHTDSVFKFEKYDTGALPDESSFNLINDASVDDLNKHLDDKKVSWRNFRPNFLVAGAHPYDEDFWKFVKIGDVIFEVLKPCTRCVLTTIDPETGVRDSKTEPLTTLKSYRQIQDPKLRKFTGNSPKLGLQLALRSEPGCFINVNDSVYVSY